MTDMPIKFPKVNETLIPQHDRLNLAHTARGLSVALGDLLMDRYIEGEHDGIRGIADALVDVTNRLTEALEDLIAAE